MPYTCYGPICNDGCQINHKSIGTAAKCMARHHKWMAKHETPGTFTDRTVWRVVDNGRMWPNNLEELTEDEDDLYIQAQTA